MAANHHPAGTSSSPATAENTLVIAHLSDTHLDGGVRSEARTRQVMDYLDALPGDLAAIVVTGDITDNGLPAEWEQAGKVLTSQRFPVLTCPGNHDGYSSYEWPLNQSHDLGDAVLILADSVILGRAEGCLGDATLAWLESTLEQLQGRRVLLGLHHPPVPLHQPWIDGPPTWKNSLDYAQPPALAFHVVTGDGRVTSHFRVVTDDGL